MEKKVLDLKQSVYALCTANPEIISILEKMGFSEIAKPGMLSTVGRFMTIPKGAAMKGIQMEDVKQVFLVHGYMVKEEDK